MTQKTTAQSTISRVVIVSAHRPERTDEQKREDTEHAHLPRRGRQARINKATNKYDWGIC